MSGHAGSSARISDPALLAHWQPTARLQRCGGMIREDAVHAEAEEALILGDGITVVARKGGIRRVAAARGGRKWFSTSVWRCPWRSSGYAPVYVSGAVSVRPARSWITRVAVAGSGASSACWSMACVVTFAAALLARAASVSFVLVTLVAVVLSSGVASGRAATVGS
ncbi:MAG: hypothetical protein H0W11_01515, partial [Gemmatimonadetes bacterium]|nr:hypothetical protein [Gemmatimonadota bacterium]